MAFKEQPQSLKRVDSENKIISAGFVSYKDFLGCNNQTISQMKLKQLASIDDFDRNSIKAESNRSKGVAVN